MATRKKPMEQDNTPDTVLGGDYAEWDIVETFSAFDKRKCTNCGYTSDFPKDMKLCIWTSCPNCDKKMRW